MTKHLIINGNDYTNYFTDRGYTVQYSSIRGNNSGTMLDGTYVEDEVAVKAIITLYCLPLNEVQIATLLEEVYKNVYCDVTYFDPRENDHRTITARRTTTTQKYKGTGTDSNDYWTGTRITFTER